MHLICFRHEHRFLSQNSGGLSVTIVLGTPFLENTLLGTCFSVVAFLSVTLITSGHSENESTNIKNYTANIFDVNMIHSSFYLSHE